jgi:SAM-dependent methyltransferase
MKATTKHLPVSPSKTLVKFAVQIASFGKGPVVDAPCGYGRNAVALAARGSTVVAIDRDRKRLVALEHLKAAYIAESASAGVSIGQICVVCADLTAEAWPIAPSSVSAIICIHFPMINLIPRFITSLQVGGHIYVETFGGHGQNFRESPQAGQLRDLFSKHVEFLYYKERKIGPPEFDSVSVTLLAQRRHECSS